MGRKVEIDLRGSKTIRPPRDAGMLYDDSGTYWPKCSLLIAEFDRGRKKTNEGKDYFGRNADRREGHLDPPPQDISAWRRLGEIDQIFYDRAGTKYPGFFRHEFNKPKGIRVKLIFLVKGKAAKEPAVLYTLKSGKTFYRIELPGGCIVDDRGIVLP